LNVSRRTHPGPHRGFTLIEAMIAVALLAITLSIAVPSYRAYVIRANRTEAVEALMAAASCQERIYIRANAYDPDACEGGTTNGSYNVTVTTSNGDQNFVASAAPQGPQTDDSCGSLSLTHTGSKTANGQTGAVAATCWTGKHSVAGS